MTVIALMHGNGLNIRSCRFKNTCLPIFTKFCSKILTLNLVQNLQLRIFFVSGFLFCPIYLFINKIQLNLYLTNRLSFGKFLFNTFL